MVNHALRFNFNLLWVAVLAVSAGCQTTDEEKVRSTVRVHMEANPGNRGFTSTVPIYRARPVQLNVQNSAILDEGSVEKAEVVDTLGGFALQIRFEQSGARLLEQYSAMNPGKHFAIFSQFGETAEQSRWLAAPQIGKRITDGILLFTPDCTREEADRIVLGLNNVVSETRRRNLIK